MRTVTRPADRPRTGDPDVDAVLDAVVRARSTGDLEDRVESLAAAHLALSDRLTAGTTGPGDQGDQGER